MEIRPVQATEGAALRDLRLKALADAPYAFATSLADAEKNPPEYWVERAKRHSAGERDIVFVAVDGEHWHGMAGGFFLPDQPDVVELFSLWVDPEKRRSGVALSLIESVVQWARERGARQVKLWVVKENTAARSLYLRAGFIETSVSKVLPSNKAVEEIMMRKEF